MLKYTNYPAIKTINIYVNYITNLFQSAANINSLNILNFFQISGLSLFLDY